MRFFGLLIALLLGLTAALPVFEDHFDGHFGDHFEDHLEEDGPKKEALIIGLVQLVGNQTLILNKILNNWDGNILSASKIQTQNSVLLKTLKQAAVRITNESPKIGVKSSIRVGRVSRKTEAATNETVETMIQLYRRFKGVGLVPSVRKNLYATLNASATLNKAIERKMPGAARPYCRKARRKIGRIFKKALKVFDPNDKGPKQPKDRKQPKNPKQPKNSSKDKPKR